MEIPEDILQHLLQNKDFLKKITEEFDKKEVKTLSDFANNGVETEEFLDVLYRLEEWLEEEFYSNSDMINVLSIAWDSNSWGPGGDGIIRFKSKYGIVKMSSSDYESDHIEIFNMDDFFPWEIENLENDFIEISSDVYNNEYLLKIADALGIGEDTKLELNGKETT
jgi:hypothetical protein